MKNKRMLLIFIIPIIISYGVFFKLDDIKNNIDSPIWKVSKGEKEIIVIGALEEIPKEYSTLGNKTKKYIKNADYLIVSMDKVKDSTYSVIRGKDKREKPALIKDKLSDAEKEKLKELSDMLGIKYEDIIETDIDRCLNILLSYIKDYVTGTPQVKLSKVITEAFYKSEKPIYECESYEESEKIKIWMEKIEKETRKEYTNEGELKRMLNVDINKKLEGFKEIYEENIGYYLDGNIEKLENSMVITKKFPELYEIGVKERNANMYEKIIKKQDKQSGTSLLSLGFINLLGDDGILSLYEKDGYKVERIN